MYIELKKGLVFWHINIMNRGNHKVMLTSETYYSKENAERAATKLAAAMGIKVRIKNK